MSVRALHYCALKHSKHKTAMVKPKPLHVEVKPLEKKVLGFNIFPAIFWMFSKMPDEMRRSAMSKTNAPKPGKPARDMFDISGESPYETEEVVPGKLWAVTYRHEDKGSTDPDTKKQMKASLVHSHWSNNVQAWLSLVENFPSDAGARNLIP